MRNLTIVKLLEKLLNDKCYFKVYFHLYCPGCGGTRAVKALLKLNIMRSLYYNPMVVVLITVELLFLISNIFKKIEKTNRFIMSSRKIRVYVLASWVIYFLIRNILLIIFGIDMLGDFSK